MNRISQPSIYLSPLWKLHFHGLQLDYNFLPIKIICKICKQLTLLCPSEDFGVDIKISYCMFLFSLIKGILYYYTRSILTCLNLVYIDEVRWHSSALGLSYGGLFQVKMFRNMDLLAPTAVCLTDMVNCPESDAWYFWEFSRMYFQTDYVWNRQSDCQCHNEKNKMLLGCHVHGLFKMYSKIPHHHVGQ